MAIRRYKPTTPGRRGASGADFAEVTRDHPEKSLVRPLHGRGGRNVHGKVTARHQGGGHKRAYRLIDFRRADKDGVPDANEPAIVGAIQLVRLPYHLSVFTQAAAIAAIDRSAP